MIMVSEGSNELKIGLFVRDGNIVDMDLPFHVKDARERFEKRKKEVLKEFRKVI